MTCADADDTSPDLAGANSSTGSGVVVSGDAASDLGPRRTEPAGQHGGFVWGRLPVALLPLALLGLVVWADFPLCPFRILVGVDCPGCGLTRATEALAQLDLATMLRLHPLAPVFAPLVLAFFGRASLNALGVKTPSLPFRVPDAVWLGLTVALLGLWGLRLAGLFGGTPDPIDFDHSVVGWLVGLAR